MRKSLLLLLSILAVCSCSKKEVWDDSHEPTSYHDGVFSFDYNGERYHQYYKSSLARGDCGCSAFALSHQILDTLVVVGGVINCPIERICFIIPIEIVDKSSGVVNLGTDDILIYGCNSSKRNASLVLDREWGINTLLGGSFSVSFVDEKGTHYNISNGHFRFVVKPYLLPFKRSIDGKSYYSFPKYSKM